MAKITISRIFEISRVLATDVGQKLQDFITFMAEFCEQTLRNLRNGLTLEDNMRCLIKTVSLSHMVAQKINADSKTPVHVQTTRTLSTSTAVQALVWYVDTDGSLVVKPSFLGSPTGTFDVTLVIYYA